MVGCVRRLGQRGGGGCWVLLGRWADYIKKPPVVSPPAAHRGLVLLVPGYIPAIRPMIWNLSFRTGCPDDGGAGTVSFGLVLPFIVEQDRCLLDLQFREFPHDFFRSSETEHIFL